MDDIYEPVINDDNGYIINDNKMLFHNKTDGTLVFAPITHEITAMYFPQQSERLANNNVEIEMLENNYESTDASSPSSINDSTVRSWSRTATLQLIDLYAQHQKQFVSSVVKADVVWGIINKEMIQKDSSDSLEGEVPRKKMKTDNYDELVSFIKENAEQKEQARKARHEERMQLQREAIDSFKTIMSQFLNK